MGNAVYLIHYIYLSKCFLVKSRFNNGYFYFNFIIKLYIYLATLGDVPLIT